MTASKLSSSFVAAVVLAAAFGIAPPAQAFTPVSELKDVTPDHWAYAAIQSLVEKYEVMEGFPDKTFKGNKTLTRYELAAALAKVMAKVEELISSATGQPISVEPGVNPEDLRTIARLQREFRDELEVLKGRVDTLDTRVNAIEKRARISGELRSDYRDFTGAAPQASAPIAEFRERVRLNADASLTDDVAAHASMIWDVNGARMPGNAFVTDGPTTPFTDMWVHHAYGSYTPGWISLHGGLVDASDVITLGSTLKIPFTSNVWREGVGGYGFVGTPGLNAGSNALAKVGAPGSPANAPTWWLSGTDVALQALDPNNTQPLSPHDNFTVAASGEAGPFNAAVAIYQPDASGRPFSRELANGYPMSLPQPEQYMQGQQMITAVGGDFGVVRAQVAAHTPGTIASDLGTFNKTVTGTLDFGTDAMGLSLQAVSRTAFNGNFTPNQFSATLASNDLFGTGFGLGLGANAGTVLGTALGNGVTAFANPSNKSLLNGLGGTDYMSYGLYLRIPGFSVVPNLAIAAQQTAGPNNGPAIASGVTLQADVLLFSLPKLQLEYSFGKFDPLPAGSTASNGLLDQTTFITNEELTAAFVMPF